MGVSSLVPGRDAGGWRWFGAHRGGRSQWAPRGTGRARGEAAEQCRAPGAKCARRGPGGDSEGRGARRRVGRAACTRHRGRVSLRARVAAGRRRLSARHCPHGPRVALPGGCALRRSPQPRYPHAASERASERATMHPGDSALSLRPASGQLH